MRASDGPVRLFDVDKLQVMGYLAECSDCDATLAVETLGDRIEHRADGSHDCIPDPEREPHSVGTKPLDGVPTPGVE